MLNHQITTYRPSDHGDLLRFFQTAFAGMGFEFDLTSKDQDLLNIPGEYQSKGGLFLVAKSKGQIIGTIALRRIAADVCELKRFYVRAEHQRRGVGTSLLRQAIDHARSGGWRCIRLDTSFKSPSAISLFRKHGFVEIGRYNDDPFAEVFMELRTD
jgi:putative acetyltransferase